MTPAFVVSTVWMLTMLAAAALAARPLSRPVDLAQIAAPFGLVVLLSNWISLQTGWVAMIAALIAAWRVVRIGSAATDRAFAGVCAGLATALHYGLGVSPWLAALPALGVLAGAVRLGRAGRGGEATRFREFALVAAAWGAPVFGLAAEAAAGWRSARALNQAVAASAVQAPPAWTLYFVTFALAAGLARGLWIRK